ncbi:MAG: response regulator transcription factor [Pseudomonadota bacterium]
MIQPDSSISILVADDHPVVRQGLAAIIDSAHDMRCVGQAGGVEEIVSCWCEIKPDVGLFDLRMADGDAVSAITRVRHSDPDAKVLVVSSFDGDEEVYRVIKAGARGYLLKDSEPEVIQDAIRAIKAGRRYMPVELSAKLADRVVTTDLSQREVEILRAAASGQSNALIGQQLDVSLSTVKFHLNNAYSKLGVSSRTAAISIAVKRGIIVLD